MRFNRYLTTFLMTLLLACGTAEKESETSKNFKEVSSENNWWDVDNSKKDPLANTLNDPNNYDAKNAKGDSKAKDNDKAKKEPTTLWSAEMNTFIGTGSMRYYIKGDKACDISYGALLNKHDEACKECSFVYELSLAKLKAAKDGDHCKDGKGASGKSYFFGHGKDSGVATLYEKKDQKWQKIAGYSYFDAKSGLWYIGFGYGAKSTKETKKK